MNMLCLQLDYLFIDEAARMTQTLHLHNTTIADADQLKTFWVIYAIEKHTSFQGRKSSVCILPYPVSYIAYTA
jgi:hypothetical protein